MVRNDLNKLAEELEKEELEAPNGITNPQVYAQLLAIYLHQNNLCDAKYLWKRIPISVKLANTELANIWTIGQYMWKRDFPSVYRSLATITWSEQIADIMKALQENIRSRAADLIAQAYSSIALQTVSEMTGLPTEQTLNACLERGWTVDENKKMVHPITPQAQCTGHTSSEDQLYKLTEFVSFLEN